MKSEFIQLKVTRQNYIQFLKKFDWVDLNTIPKNFKNNLIWNAGHALVTQQLLHYYLSDVPMHIERDWVEQFKKGSIPQHKYDEKMVEELYASLLSTADQLVEDYQKGLFKTYQNYSTSFGYEISNIEAAIQFNNMHESMHLGYCLALKNEL